MAKPQELFRSIYRSTRVRNASNACFIPTGVLERRLEESAIDQLLSVCAVSEGSYSHVRDTIVAGGIKTLCILVLIDSEKSISKFVTKCYHGLLDHKLPRNKEALTEIWTESEKIQSFYDMQWEFLAPTFKFGSHQDYEKQIIFPFMSSTPIDPKHRGQNSDIFEITIIEGHLKSNQKSAEASERKIDGKVSHHARIFTNIQQTNPTGCEIDPSNPKGAFQRSGLRERKGST